VERVDELLDAMAALEREGGRSVIHCRGGLGRTGTVAGCYLVRRGHSPADAIVALHRARGPRCPENTSQKDFIAAYAEHGSHLRETRRVASPAPAPAPSSGQTSAATIDVRASASPPAAATTTATNAESTPTATTARAPTAPWYATALAGLRAVSASATSRSRLGDAGALLAAIEREVAAAPEACFTFASDGSATLTAAGHTFAAGRFATPSIGELRARLAARHPAGEPRNGRFLLSVLHGAPTLSDIGTLQATAAPRTLFQVASQFNCLEAPSPRLVPVRDYVHDYTQGPRASVSAFPGTFLRHYRAPAADGTRFVQRDGHCIDLLADAVPAAVAEVRGGYLQTSNIHERGKLASSLQSAFDHVRVGAHDGVEVVFGQNWNGVVPSGAGAAQGTYGTHAAQGGAPRIAQVFTSTMALGGYGHDDGAPALATARRQLLRAAYVGTLLAALDFDCDTVVLTMIGGGVFGNPRRDIWDAIHWALADVEPLVTGTTQIIVNTREPIADQDRAEVRARAGAGRCRGGALSGEAGDRPLI